MQLAPYTRSRSFGTDWMPLCPPFHRSFQNQAPIFPKPLIHRSQSRARHSSRSHSYGAELTRIVETNEENRSAKFRRHRKGYRDEVRDEFSIRGRSFRPVKVSQAFNGALFGETRRRKVHGWFYHALHVPDRRSPRFVYFSIDRSWVSNRYFSWNKF